MWSLGNAVHACTWCIKYDHFSLVRLRPTCLYGNGKPKAGGCMLLFSACKTTSWCCLCSSLSFCHCFLLMDAVETVHYFEPHFPFLFYNLCWGTIMKEISFRDIIHFSKGFFFFFFLWKSLKCYKSETVFAVLSLDCLMYFLMVAISVLAL